MLKILLPEAGKLKKCGEVYRDVDATSNYYVACCLCGSKVAFDKFPDHFAQQHPKFSNTEDLAAINPISDGIDPVKLELEEEFLEDKLVPFMEVFEDEKPIDIADLHLNTVANEIEPTVPLLEVDEADEDDLPLLRRFTRNKRTGKTAKKLKTNSTKKKQTVVKDAKEMEVQKKEQQSELNLEMVNLDEVDTAKDDSDSEYYPDKNPEDNSEDEFNPGEKKKPYPCPDCHLSYSSKYGLYGHQRVHHEKAQTERKRVPSKAYKRKERHFKCDECGQMFFTEINLTSHVYKQHTGMTCEICGKEFVDPGNLRRHQVRHTGIKAHKCAECELCFYTAKELKAHMVRHTQILPTICEVCGKRFRDRGRLREHMKRHTGLRPFKCEVCSKCFFDGYDLRIHKLSHSDHRPFVCNVCGARTKSKKALRVHKKQHDTELNHVCKVCGKGFVQSNGLQAHMRTHDATMLTVNSTCTESIVDNNTAIAVSRNFLV